ncbi:MAG: hypothetical protein KGJ02_03195 [Verrucomicrobiota bacterium]|nr:hypothetical protein [Verrucomicrobiota bacterium]
MKRIFFLITFAFFVQAETILPVTLLLPDDVYEEQVLRDQYFYLEGGTAYLVIPSLGLGWRWQRNRSGIDISAETSLAYSLRASASLMVYPKPNLSDQWYFGLGGSGLFAPLLSSQHGPFAGVGPTLSFGKSYQNDNRQRRFFQGTIDLLFDSHAPVRPLPYATLMYGWGF